jgi:hypothetical protein
MTPGQASALAATFNIVRRDGVAALEAICDRLNDEHPEFYWSVDQCWFDVPDDQAEFGILPWFPIARIEEGTNGPVVTILYDILDTFDG